MKLLFVHDHIFVRYKGKIYSNTFSYDILKRYIQQFSSITFVARYKDVEDSVDLPLASGDGVEFILLDSISNLSSFFGLRQKYKKLLINLIKQHDRVIVRLPSEFAILTAKIAQQHHKSYMAEVVGCGWGAMINYGGVTSKIYAPLLYIRMQKAVKGAGYVLYVTNEFLQKRYPASSDTKTISLSNVNISVSKKVLKYRLSKIELLKEKVIFGTIAKVDLKYKAIDTVIRTLSMIDTNLYDFEYRIVGDGNHTQLQKLAKKLHIENKVFFDGLYTSKKSLNSWLDNIDIYIQPSKQEGLPRALIEAMSRGCPAIASDVGGIPELLDQEMLFSHKDITTFIYLLETLPIDIDKMKEQAIKNHKKSYEFETHILEQKRKEFLEQFKN